MSLSLAGCVEACGGLCECKLASWPVRQFDKFFFYYLGPQSRLRWPFKWIGSEQPVGFTYSRSGRMPHVERHPQVKLTCSCGAGQLAMAMYTGLGWSALTPAPPVPPGDSRAVLCRSGEAVALSLDHKATRSDEVVSLSLAVCCCCYSCYVLLLLTLL